MNRRINTKYNTFVLDFLKKHTALHVQQAWCSVDNQIAFKKIRLECQQPNRTPSSFLLFCKDHRSDLQKKHPYWPSYLIMKELGQLWNAHKKTKSAVFQHYSQLYQKTKFFKRYRTNITAKYSHLSAEEIDTILTDMYNMSIVAKK